MAKVRYTIEPGWTHQTHSDVIEIDDEELEGLTPEEREKHIEGYVEQVVNDMCPWGWEEEE
jgi:hypothetical protein